MALEDVRKLGANDTVPFKTATAAASSFVMGGITGAVVATWRDVPAVERNVAMPALIKTGRVMSSYAVYFAAVGGTFALVDGIAGEVRGKKDIWNGVIGGAAAGCVVGIRGKMQAAHFRFPFPSRSASAEMRGDGEDGLCWTLSPLRDRPGEPAVSEEAQHREEAEDDPGSSKQVTAFSVGRRRRFCS